MYKARTHMRVRTKLLVIPSSVESIASYFLSYQTLRSQEASAELRKKYSDQKVCRRFASKLHGFTHMPLADMEIICSRAGVMTPVLRQALHSVLQKCTTCKSTGRPLASRKISFRRMLVPFNHHVQLDFLFMSEMENLPILHMVDISSAFSVATMLESRELKEVKSAFEHHWINIYGPPSSLSGDPEFDKGAFKDFLSAHSIKFEPRPARRHNKIGVVESKNAILRLLTTRLLQDAEYFAAVKGSQFTFLEILSRATFLSNIMYGGRKLSSFELIRGYTPSLMGLPQTPISEELVSAYQEQVAKRAIATLEKTRNPRMLPPSQFRKGIPVYYFKRGPKFGTWKVAFVRQPEQHSLLLSSNPNHQGPSIRAAYEDVRLVPKSALLVELDQMGFSSPLGASSPFSDCIVEITEGRMPDRPETASTSDPSPNSSPIGPLASPTTKSSPARKGSIDLLLNKKVSLWSSHPNARSFATGEKRKVVELPEQDIGSSFNPPLSQKDIGASVLRPAPTPCELASAEQEILQQAKQVLGTEHVSEFRTQFLPRWVVEKAIQKEKSVYKGCYAEVSRRSLPKNENIVSSHHFFHIKDDGQGGALRLKCRLVPHGNRDRERDGIRKDSSSAQFPVIRLVLSIASTLGLPLATLDIKGAYLQGGELKRDIFMVPPRGWAKPGILWKLLAPTYGLVESGRLWQLTIERWMHENHIEPVPGLPQLFILREENRSIRIALAKVVDDILLAGLPNDLKWFHPQISKRFTVGKFDTSGDLIFNRLRIHRAPDGSVIIGMQEYMNTIKQLEIPRMRRKQFDEPATPSERTAFLGLTGSLNFLGHGVLPQASFAASYLQQRTGRLRVADLLLANHVLHELQALVPILHYKRPANLDITPRYLAFSDASQGKTSYGQTGYLSGLFMPAGGGGTDAIFIFHVLDWTSAKQARVSFSSIGAEILAAALPPTGATLWRLA